MIYRRSVNDKDLQVGLRHDTDNVSQQLAEGIKTDGFRHPNFEF